MVIDLKVLESELDECRVQPGRLVIDRNASVLSPADHKKEGRLGLQGQIGSTLSGTGLATARKVLRGPDVRLASAIAQLAPYVGDVATELNAALDRRETVLVEGTQGFGLSLHHSDSYPFVTSRDTTAAAFLSEAGLSPLQVSEVLMVVRTYPIRVAGNSGPLAGEIAWEHLRKRSGYPHELAEYTSVTKRLRRVGEFDWPLVERAVMINRPSGLVLHGADYLTYSDLGKTSWNDLSAQTKAFVLELERRLGVQVKFVFTGPEAEHIVDRRRGSDRAHEIERVGLAEAS
jgi:adenylosuccinate synthase